MIPPRATMRLQLHNGFTFADAAKAGAVYGAARGQPSLCLANPDGTTRLDARLRCDRSDAGQSRARRRGGIPPPGRHATDAPAGVDPGYRPEPHGGGRAERLVAGRAASRAGQPARAGFSISTGIRTTRCCRARCCCRSWASHTATRWRAARSSSPGRVATGRSRYFDNWFPVRPEDAAKLTELGAEAYDAANRGGTRRGSTVSWSASTIGWRSGARANDEINWRRFFDINELVGVRVEKPAVLRSDPCDLVPAVRGRA